MYIPSYDDLTPSIPDVSQGEVFASVKELLHVARARLRLSRSRFSTTSSGEASPECATPSSAGRRAGGTPDAGRRTWHAAGAPTPLFAALHGRDPARLLAIARDFSPRLERHGSACVVLDVAGLGRLLGDAHAIGAELARAGAARVAVAPAQIAARLLARARPGLTVVDREADRAIADVPLGVLQQLLADDHGHTFSAQAATRTARVRTRERSVCASGPSWPPWPSWPSCERTFDVLARWGLSTLGEFAALPARDLSARLGQDGLALQQLARGIDRAPLVPDPGVPRFIQSMELEWPLEALEPLSFVLARLLDPLAAGLERADRGAAAIRLDLRLVDRSMHTRMLQLPAAMRDPRVLRTLLLLDLESHPPPTAVDIVSIEADPAPSRIVQYSLLERALPSAETLATLNARLGALVGDARCGSPVLPDTHRPDGFEMRRFTSDAASQPPNPRTPEPPVRRFRPPVAVRVTVERGRPARVAIDRQGMPGGRIERAAGPWRTSGAWWVAERWNRDEWDVAFSDGTLCRLFRDRDSGVWFVDGVID